MDSKSPMQQKSPVELLANQVQLLQNLYNLQVKQQKEINQQLDNLHKQQLTQGKHFANLVSTIDKARGPSYFGRYALAGAIIASIVGALWVMQYLQSTSIGFVTLVWDYVSGEAHNLDNASEGMFVVTTRFILAFSFSWGPITSVLMLVGRIFESRRA